MKIKNILVSQPQPADLEKSPYGELCRSYKLEIDFRKFITIEGVSAQEFRRAKGSFNDHTAVILTSKHAVNHFFRMAKEMRFEVPDSLKYFCISESTAYYLQKYVQYRKRKIFYGKQTFAHLMDLISKNPDEKYIVPSSDVNNLSMFKMLDAGNIDYTRTIIYRTVPSDLKDIDINKYQMLIFFSPAGVESLKFNFPDYEQGEQIIAAFGPTTKKAIEKEGLKLNIPAPTKTAPSMTMAIDQYLEVANKPRRRKSK
ncbi:MAG: uroporphyrinogen-III synthase [Chlorobi bacterium]|nr:uroporphyrinogen-III synthase [Chlorobiota bacterium]